MELARRHLLQHVVWGKSFEESLMLGHSLLESGQVICLQVLLHLRHLVIQWFLLGYCSGKLLSASPGFSFPHPGQSLLGGLEIWSRWPGMKSWVVFPSVETLWMELRTPWRYDESCIGWVFFDHRMEPEEILMTSHHLELAHPLPILQATTKEYLRKCWKPKRWMMLPSLHSENNPLLLAEGVRDVNLVVTGSGARIEFNPRVRNARLAEWWKLPRDCFLHQFSSYLPHLLHSSCLPSPLKSWNKQRTFNIKNSYTTHYAEFNVSQRYHFCNDHHFSSDIIRIKVSSSASRAHQAAPAKWSVCNLWSAPPQSSSKRPHVHAATGASLFCGNWITIYIL